MDAQKIKIMGILNATPDSFSDGGLFNDAKAAITQAEMMMQNGASLIDVGGESTAPGSQDVTATIEWQRIQPILEGLAERDIPFSVDTWKADIAEQAIVSGAKMINDVTALRGDSRMWKVVEEANIPFVVMYSKDNSPRTTLNEVSYDDPIVTIAEFFCGVLKTAESKGIDTEKFILDPGMGAFLSSDPQVSFAVLKRLWELKKMFPENQMLVGTSRKGFLRAISNAEQPQDRLIASVVSALAAARNGATFLRVHDVKETAEALRTESAIANA